jgi:hypothetical protein
MEIRPGVVFERLFGTGSTPAEREVRRLGQLSLLDGIREELSALRQDLGAPDRLRLEQFTNEIREVELRIQQGLQASELASAMDTPVGYPDSYEELIKLHYDMIALAFQADITRVAAVLGARDYSGRTFPLPDNDLFDGGISGGMQGLSRHQENPLTIRRYAILNRYHVYLMSYLAGKLDAIPEGDGTVLDHSLILYGSNMGNSNQNQHSNVPHFLVGGLDGRVAGGRHLAYPHKTVPTGNLLLDILRRFGTEVESQGDSTGLLVGL